MTLKNSKPVAHYDLDHVAVKLKVHPRTVLRALSGVENTYWAPDHNPEVSLLDLSIAYGVEFDVVSDIMVGRDDLLKPSEAADYLSRTYGREVSVRVLRSRSYTPVISRPKVVRYSRLLISRQHVENYEK